MMAVFGPLLTMALSESSVEATRLDFAARLTRATIYNHMVACSQLSADDLDRLFGALADATRRDILARVMDADASVSELAARYEMSFAAVQKHVAVLERAQLVTKRRDGRAQRVAGNPAAVRRANRLLTQFEQRWHARVGRLDELLATSDQGAPHAGRRDSQGPRSADDDSRRPVRLSRRPRLGRVR
jgi:DNA-binding transcriptional ArsR family regulator